MSDGPSYVDNAIRRAQGQIIDGDEINWRYWLSPKERSRIIPATNLIQAAKDSVLLGPDAQSGLYLPWDKAEKIKIIDGKLAIWTGFQHHGKSTMLKHVMLDAIRQGYCVLICSMEETPTDLLEGLIHLYAGTTMPTVEACNSFAQFINGKLWIYDQQGEVDAIRMVALMRYASHEHGVNQGVIDSMMMLGLNRDDYDAQRRFISMLKAAAKDCQITLHLVAHMRKRDGKSGDEVPGNVHDISGGHELASMADYVFNVFRNKKDNDMPASVLRVEKQRGRKPYNWIGSIGLHHHDSGQFLEGNYTQRFD